MTKFYRPNERSWKEGLTLDALHRIACKSVGREDADSGVNFPDLEQDDVERVVSDMWAQDKKKPVPAASSSANPIERESVSVPSASASASAAVTSRSPSPLRKRKTREEDKVAVPVPEAYAGWFDDFRDGDRHQDVSPERIHKRPRREDTAIATESESSSLVEVQDPATPVLQPLTVTTNIPAPGLISPVSLEKPSASQIKTKRHKVSVKQERVSPSPCRLPTSSTTSKTSNLKQPSKSLKSPTISIKRESKEITIKIEAESPSVTMAPSAISSPRARVEDQGKVKESTLYWFAPTHDERCETYQSWKNEAERNQRTHTLNALLHGCGWTRASMKAKAELENHWVKQGMIVIDECDSNWKETMRTIRKRLDEAADDINTSNSSSSGVRNEIVVFGCKSRTNPLYGYRINQ